MKMIADACWRLLQAKRLDAISISTLCQEAKVSRQTFYSLFSTKENVIIYLLIRRCPPSLQGYLKSKEVLTLPDICHCYALYMDEQLPLIRLIFDNGLSHLLATAFYEGIIHSSKILFAQTGTQFDDYIAHFIAGGLATIAKVYLEKEPAFDFHTFEQLALRLFTGSFFRMQAI